MLYAEWSGKQVKIYTETRQFMRMFNARSNVIGVQCSGDGNDARIAIAMDNGKTDLFTGTGQLVRRG